MKIGIEKTAHPGDTAACHTGYSYPCAYHSYRIVIEKKKSTQNVIFNHFLPLINLRSYERNEP
jgi:hypothetical protein